MLKNVLNIFLITFVIISCNSDDAPSEPPKETPVEKVVLKEVKVIDGTIFLTWNPVKKMNFDKALLKIKKPRSTSLIELSKEIVSSNTFNDSINVDHMLEYSITLENEISSSISNSLNLITDGIDITSELTDLDRVKISYSKHPIYKNFDYFKFEINPIYIRNLDPRGGEVIAARELIFGGNFGVQNYGLIFTPYKNNNVAGIPSNFSLKMGEEFEKKRCSEYVYDHVEDVYYGVELIGETHANALREVYLHKLSGSNLSTINSKLLTTTNEPFGHMIIDPNSNNLVIDLSFKSIEVDKNDFSVINQWSAYDYIDNIANAHTYYRNGLIILENVVGNVSIFNATSKDLIYQEPYQYTFNISDHGRFFYNNYGIYEINNDIVTLKTTTNETSSSPIRDIDFSNNECVYYGFSRDPTIYDFNTGVKKIIPNLNSGSFVHWNKIKNVIIIGQFHIMPEHYSLITFYDVVNNVQKKIRVYDSHTVGQFFRFLDNKLIFSEGQYLEDYY